MAYSGARHKPVMEECRSNLVHLKLMNLIHLKLMNLIHLQLRQFQMYPDNLLYVQTPRISPELLSYQLLPGDRNVGLRL